MHFAYASDRGLIPSLKPIAQSRAMMLPSFSTMKIGRYACA
jgi:hypothetical protein